MSWLRIASAMAMLLFVVSCSDPAEEEMTPPGEEEEAELKPEDADPIMNAFSFTSATKINGKVPEVDNTSLIKMAGGDTLYAMAGVNNIIRISHPASKLLSGIFMAVEGSTFYYEVEKDDEEQSDTVSVVMIGFDPEEVDGTAHVPIQLTAYDENKQPIDIIERILTIEDPSDPNPAGCGLLEDGDTTYVQVLSGGWIWEWTVVLDYNDQPVVINAPLRSYITEQTHYGCCEESACPALVIDPNTHIAEWKYDSEMSIVTRYAIEREYFNFFQNGTFHRFTWEFQSALDPEATDYCTGQPAMVNRREDVYYYGVHDYVEGNTRISYAITHADCEDQSFCGYGSRGGQVTVTCHNLLITAGTEGQKEMRMYRRVQGTFYVTGAPNITIQWLEWKD